MVTFVPWMNTLNREDDPEGRIAAEGLDDSVVASRSDHELVDGECVTCRPVEASRGHFDPSLHPHDPHNGEFIGTPGGAASSALKDVLNLAGKIDLDPNEKLIGSGKVDGDIGGIRLALTEQGSRKFLRFGVGPQGYGQRNRDEGIPAWDGNPSRAPLSKPERDRLSSEADALDEEYDSASPGRREEIDARLDGIRDQLSEQDFNGTAKLDEYSMGRLADKIRPALAEAVEQEKAENAAWDELEALQAKGNPDPARVAKLREIARVDSTDYITFAKGIVPGSEWGDVHFSVELDDPSQGPYVILGVMPKGAPDDWGDGRDWKGQFDAAETLKFLRLLGKYGGQVAARSAESHVLRNGECVTCPPIRTVARFNPKEPRNPHSGEWVKTPGGAGVVKKLLDAIDDGDDEGILEHAEALDKPSFDALSPRQRKDIEDELSSLSLGRAVPREQRWRAGAVLEKLKSGAAPSAPKAKTPKPPKVQAPKVAKKKIKDEWLTHGRTTVDPELEPFVKDVFEFHDPETGFHTEVYASQASYGSIQVSLQIMDDAGRMVGQAERTIKRNDDGDIIVDHELFKLERRNPPIQGGGFASRWLAKVETEYRAADIKQIELHANIDVGGYAWAKMGFDFGNEDTARNIARRFADMLDVAPPELQPQIRHLIDRAHSGVTPTPLEFAMLGWTPGAKRWFGKDRMLGSAWYGVKQL